MMPGQTMPRGSARPGLGLGLTALGLMLGLMLGGCAFPLADPARIAPGTPASQIVATLGQPTARYRLPEGGERLQYSQAPMGVRVYDIDLDPRGQAVRVEQALDESLFPQRIAPDHWTREDVLREYGPPMRVLTVQSFDGHIWVWHYADIMQGPRLLYIDIDPGGVVRGYSVADESMGGGRADRH